MSWETTTFGSGGIGLLAATAAQSSWVAVGNGTDGVLLSELHGDPDVPPIVGQGSTPFSPRDLSFDIQNDGLLVADDLTKSVYRCATPMDTPTTWTETGYLASAATQKARCVVALSSSRHLVISGGNGLWRKNAGVWANVLTSATAFASTTRLYRRCATYVGTAGSMLAYDPDVGLYKSSDFGATWFLAWTHTGGGDGAQIIAGIVSSNAWLIDGTTIWRLPNADSTSAVNTWDNAGLGVPVDCDKDPDFGCTDARGDIAIIEDQGDGTKKVFRSQIHGASGEEWVDEEDGNLAPISGGLESLGMSDDGWIFAADPDSGVIRGTFDTGRLTVTVTPETQSSSVGGGFDATITLSAEAPVGGQRFWIDTTDWTICEPDAVLDMDEGETEMDLPIAPDGAGSCTITVLTRPQSMSNGHDNNAAGVTFAALGLTGGVPIQDLGLSTYEGREGGLYEDGENDLPTTNTYSTRGAAKAAEIVPRNAAGNQDLVSGKILFGSWGFSNPLHEWDIWNGFHTAGNDKVQKFQGAQSGMDIANWYSPFPLAPAAAPAAPATGNTAWDTFFNRIRAAGTDAQVQAIWAVFAVQGPAVTFAGETLTEHENYMLPRMQAIRNYLEDNLPNLKILFVSNRTYGGYAALDHLDGGNPEPWAYQMSFITRSLVMDSVNSSSVLYTTWGPEWWGNGTTPRATDNVKWLAADYWDGTHESLRGNMQTTRFLQDFFTTSPLTDWYNE